MINLKETLIALGKFRKGDVQETIQAKLDADGSYSRNQLPQINSDVFNEVVEKLKKHGVTNTSIKLKNAKLAQNEYKESKVENMLRNGYDCTQRTYIQGNDGQIVDGTHSIISGLVANPEARIKVIKVDKSTPQLVKILNQMKVTNKESL